MAGIFPALMLGASIWLTWWWLARGEDIASPPRRPFKDVVTAVVRAAWALGLPVIIIFGLKLGVFTPTEAGVVAAVYALFVSTVVYRELKWSQLYGVFVHAARTTSVVMLLVAGGGGERLADHGSQHPGQVAALLQPLHDDPKLLMAAIMVLVMIVGTALDMAPTILILTPVLMPLVNAAGIDPVYFGVLFMINNAIGLVTPPVGVVLNTVAGVGKIGMDAVTRGVVPFMIAEFILMFLMVLFPQLVTVPARWFY
jgi:tripartite ATP-independent transporter DctM subunit